MDYSTLTESPPGKPPAKKRKSSRTPLLIAAAVAAGLLLTAGWLQYGTAMQRWFTGWSSMAPEAAHIIPLRELQVNLADPGGRRYLRLKICFAAGDKALVKEVNRREPEIRSKIISLLRCLTVQDLEGREGMERLERELLDQVNSVLVSGELQEIYFDNILIQ